MIVFASVRRWIRSAIAGVGSRHTTSRAMSKWPNSNDLSLCVIFVVGQLRPIGFHQRREEGAEIEPWVRCANSGKIIDAPNHARGAEIETGVTVADSVIEGPLWARIAQDRSAEAIRDDVPDSGGNVVSGSRITWPTAVLDAGT